ncbi:MAG: translation elongation factor Ts [Bdellovibrionales bacterium]|nr:translation elongation factor Ts [Bdellovibrionales bacterium]
MSSVAEKVKELRSKTGAGIMHCKKALQESSNDLDQAVLWLRKNNLNQALKKSGRKAKEGVVASYIHGAGRIGVLLEVNSETDFVARNTDFQDFVRDLRLHIAAMSPSYIKEEDVPAELVEKEKNLFSEQAEKKSKDPKVKERISAGLYKKWLETVCLLNQEFVRQNQEGPKETVGVALSQLSAKVGENIVIRRFVRFALGEESS